jgi:hypothetical protein
MPFTYLGLPLGTTKLTIQEFMSLLTRIEKRLMGITPRASYAGRLTLCNSVLSSLPAYIMCMVQLPIEIIEQINNYRRHCLWRGCDLNKKGNCLVAWSIVQRPKDQGGLGIIDFAAQNKALLLKHLHKFFNKVDVPWIDLTWEVYYSSPLPPQARGPQGSFWW